MDNKITAQQAIMLNRVEEDLPSTTDIGKLDDDDELQEIMKRETKSLENLITQFKGSKDLLMHEILGLDKQLRSIWGLLKVKTVKKVHLDQHIMQERCKLEKIYNILDNTDVQ